MIENKLFGCFVSSSVDADFSETEKKISFEKARSFRNLLYMENGFENKISVLLSQTYGKDLQFILFQYYINPIHDLEEIIPKIEKYKRKEKAIGIPIIVTDENFFLKEESDRMLFFTKSLFDKISLLKSMVHINNLDTDIALLEHDLNKLFNNK